MRVLRSGLVVLLVIFAIPTLVVAAGGAWLPGFEAPGVTGSVSCLLDLQGDLIAAGSFSAAANVPATNIARWDGVAWHPLGEGLPCAADALATHEGELIVACGHAVRRWNGAEWITLGTANGPVTALASWAGGLFAAGRFTQIAGVAASCIARWNGAAWEPLGAGLNAAVNALIVCDGALVAGGDFTPADVAARHVARWDGVAWSSLADGPGAAVRDLEVYGGELIAAGRFEVPGGEIPTATVKAWDGTAWRSLGTSGSCPEGFKLAAAAGRLYLLCGNDHMDIPLSCSFGQDVRFWDGSSWTAFYGQSGGYHRIADICAWDGGLAVGGSITTAGEVAHGLAVWRDDEWERLGPAGQGVGQSVRALAIDGPDVLAAGTFPTAGAVTCAGGARWTGQDWSALVAGQLAFCSYALAVGVRPSGAAVIGGAADLALFPTPCLPAAWCSDCPPWPGASSINAIFAFDGSLLFGLSRCADVPLVVRDGFTGGMGDWGPGSVRAFVVHQGRLYAGGSFAAVDGNSVASLAVWEDGAWGPVGDGPGSRVQALASWNGLLVAGGSFAATEGGKAGLKVWDGQAWSALGLLEPASIESGVTALAVFDGDLVVGGLFSALDGVPAANLARWDGDGWHEVGDGIPQSFVYALASVGDRLYVGGSFSRAGDTPAANFACWQGSIVPVRLTGLSCARAEGGARLDWTLDGATNARFHVWREEPARDRLRLTAEPLAGVTTFAFIDPTPPAGEADYWLEELAAGGGSSAWHGPAHLLAAAVPTALRLAQNRPNPFNPRTTFALALPQPGRARLTILDARGREVARPFDADLPAGVREVVWDGCDAQGRALPSGVYFARLDSGGRLAVTKVTLAR
jgi:trimeric autotransporter adhesin